MARTRRRRRKLKKYRQPALYKVSRVSEFSKFTRKRGKKFKVEFTFYGEPLSKSNTLRAWRGRIYVPARIRHYEERLHLFAKEMMRLFHRRATSKTVKVEAIYYLGTLRRKDLHNLPKTYDALEGAVFKNDDQIQELHIIKRLDRDNPRMEIKITETHDPQWPV